MKKKFVVQTLLSLFALVFFFGCASQQPANLPSFSAQAIDADNYVSKVDNFLIILDASSSMETNAKFDVAKAVANRMNLTIPEMGQTAGLRSFGHHPAVCKKDTNLFYGMAPYSTTELGAKLGLISKPGGNSPLSGALKATIADFEGLSGSRNVVIIISDGLQMKASVSRAQALKDKYGDTLCIYTIQVGDSAEGQALLEEVAKIGGCGKYLAADEVLTAAGMTAFVTDVFLQEKEAPAPAPKPVVTTPGRQDSDGDGVYDDEDKCPGTPRGAKVNAVGCWFLDNVLFDFDKAVIKAEAFPQLDAVVKILKENPAMSVELQGHTDNIGPEKYNQGLSLRRANAVADYMVDKGVARNRLATTGFGFSKPVALNETKFGRSLNRRVEIHPY